MPAAEPGLMDRLLSNPIMMGIAGAVALILLVLGWLLVKRRRETEDRFDESVLLVPGESSTVELEAESEVAESVEQAEDTSFISDFSPSDIDALQEETGEVDPSAEADVYIAYGRYQQAESLIEQAIEKNPDRLDLKQKLLEIYFTTRNAAAFTELAEQLQSDGVPGMDPQIWSRVQSMGRELAPGNDLFGTGEVEQEEAAPKTSTVVDDEQLLVTDSEALASMDLDLDTELSELQEASEEISAFTDKTVSEGAEPKGGTVEPGAEGQEEDSEFAIHLSDLDSLEDIEVSDLSLDSEEVAPEIPSEPATTRVGEQDTVLDESEFELSQFDIGEGEPSDAADSDALSNVLEEESGESEALSDVLGEAGDEGEEEDIGTKLDLARAYIDMGDSEGASEFLEEVLEEGNEQQKAQAKKLLDRIR
jgi:pilus assembly protein FimV